MNRITERGETSETEDDGPLSYCDKFLTPIRRRHNGTHHKNI